MEVEKILIDKDGFKFSKIGANNYNTTFSIENPSIILAKVINFDIIKLIYELNPDIYEYVNLEKVNENEAIITLVMKHFFEDLGMPQRYSYMRMKKTQEKNIIIFEGEAIRTIRPVNVPLDAQLVAFETITSTCEIVTPHKIKFTHNISFQSTRNVPPYVEKVVSIITNKIFKRVKQFIENIRI
jgi:hypothetical protein